MLVLKNILKDYYVASETVHALKGVSINFGQNEFVSILGPSGCGKTTLLNIIGGLDKYTSGDLIIDGRSTKDFSDHDWDVYRNRRIGFVFQSYNLIPHQTILGNVELALTIAGVSREERTRRAKEALDKVGLKGQYNKKPNQLSGGQCQRVAIARALAMRPNILCFDEPTSALDPELTGEVLKVIKELKESTRSTMIIVTHEMEFAKKVSDKVIFMANGVVEEMGTPRQVFDHPKSAKTIAFLQKSKENTGVEDAPEYIKDEPVNV